VGVGSGAVVGTGVEAGVPVAEGVAAAEVTAASTGEVWHALKSSSNQHNTTNNIRFIKYPLSSVYIQLNHITQQCRKQAVYPCFSFKITIIRHVFNKCSAPFA